MMPGVTYRHSKVITRIASFHHAATPAPAGSVTCSVSINKSYSCCGGNNVAPLAAPPAQEPIAPPAQEPIAPPAMP